MCAPHDVEWACRVYIHSATLIPAVASVKQGWVRFDMNSITGMNAVGIMNIAYCRGPIEITSN